MAKFVPDSTLNSMLNVFEAATVLFICSSQPTTYAEASSTYALADVVIDSGDFTKADGDTSGRKTTVAQQAGITIDTSGTAAHIAIGISGSSTLLAVTTCTSQAVTAGNTATVNAFDIEVGDVA